MRLRPQNLAAVQQLPEVAEIRPILVYHKVLDAARPLLNMPAGWNDARIGGEDRAGAGVTLPVAR